MQTEKRPPSKVAKFIAWLGLIAFSGFFLTMSAFFSCAAVGDSLRCIKSDQRCYYQTNFLWIPSVVDSFRFTDFVNASPSFLYEGRYGFKYYALKIHLVYNVDIMVTRPSSYIAKKEAPKLNAYLGNPNTNEFILPPVVHWASILWALVTLVAGAYFILLPVIYRRPKKMEHIGTDETSN